MRTFLLCAVLSAVLISLPAIAVAEEGQFDDSRRPKLKMSTREDVPYDLGVTGRFDGSVGMELGDSDWEEYYFQQINLSAFMGRLKTILTDPQYLGGQEELKGIVEYMDEMGAFSYENSITEYAVSGNTIEYSALSTFAAFEAESFKGRFFAIADEAPVSSKYVRPDQYLMYFSLPNFYETLMLQLEEMVRQQQMLEEEASPTMTEILGEMDLEQLEEMLAVMKVMGVDKIINDSLTGELALVVYELENLEGMGSGDVQPGDFDVALMLGMKDGAYLEKLSGTYGPELGLKQMPDQDGWKVFGMEDQPGIGMFYNGELLVITPDMSEVMANVKSAVASGAVNAPACQLYFDLNLSRLDGELVGPLTQMAMAQAETDEDFDTIVRSMAYLVDKPVSEQLGHLTMVSGMPGGNSKSIELSLQKPALRYAAFHLFAAIGALASNEEWLEQLNIDELMEGIEDIAAAPQPEQVSAAAE